MKKNLLPLALLLVGTTAYSQVGIGTLTPNKSSQLDVVSTNKGILIPRVALENSVDATTITAGNVNSLLVFNTNTKNDITPGYYYWFDNKWMRVVNDADVIALDKNTTNTSLTMVNGELVLTDSDGNIVSIPLSQINIVTTLVNNNNGTYTYTSEDGTVTVVDVPGSVVNQFEDIVNSGPVTINGNTYNTIEEYIENIVKQNETVTTLVNNNNGTYTYTSEDGTVTVVDVPQSVVNQFENIVNSGPVTINGNTYTTIEQYIKDIVKQNETVTTLVNNNNGTYTYTSEDGTVTVVDVPQSVVNQFEDIVNSGPVTINGNTYNTIEEYIENIVKENETVTTLVNNNNGTYTYTSEDGTVTVVDVPQSVVNQFENIVNSGPVTINGNTYTTIEQYIEDIVKQNETVTTLVNNNNGTYTYTSEDGTVTVVDVPADIVNQFNDIVNSGPVVVNGSTYNTIEEYIENIVKQNETVTTLVNNNNGTYTYTSEDGTVTVVDVPQSVVNQFENIVNSGPVTINGNTYTTIEQYIEDIVKQNETVTTLVNNNNGTYTYTSEDGTVTVVDVPADIVNQFNDIVNSGPVVVNGNTYNTIEEYIENIVKENETVTTLVNNNNGTYTYTSEDGTVTVVDVPQSVVNQFENIVNSGPVTINGNTYTTIEQYIEDIVKQNETVTKLVNNNNGTYTYTSEDGTVTVVDVPADIVNQFNDIVNSGPVVVNGNTYNTIEEYIENIVKENETVTTLVNNNNGTYTYTSEDGTLTVVDVPQSVVNQFENIVNSGPVTINGNTYNTIEEYFENIVKENETVTTLSYNTTNNELTYTGENGTPVVLNLNEGSAAYNAATNILTYTNEAGVATPLNLNNTGLTYDATTSILSYLNTLSVTQTVDLGAIVKANETLTTLAYNATNNELTYTGENGTPVVLNLNEGSVAYNATTNVLTYTNEAGVAIPLNLNNTGLTYEPATSTLSYVNTLGLTQTVDLGAIVAANETLTTLAYNATNNELTYTGENGTPVVLNLNEGSVAYNATTNILTYTNEAGLTTPLNLNNTGLTYDAATSTLSYVNTLGITQTVDLGAIVAANETNTELSIAAGALVYKNEQANNANVNLISTDTGNNITAGTDGALFAAAVEPWNVQGTTDKATLNTQNIYQNGNVGIGDFTTRNPITNLDVRGAARIGQPNLDEVNGVSTIGQFSLAAGWDNTVSGVASAAFGSSSNVSGEKSFSFGHMNTVSAGNSTVISGYSNIISGVGASMTGGVNNEVASVASGAFGQNLVIGSGHNFSFAFGSNNAITGVINNPIGSNIPRFQIGNGSFGNNRNALTIMEDARTAIGVSGTEVAAKPTELLDLGGTATAGLGGVKIRNINSAAYTGNTATDKMVVADATGVLKTVAIPSSINIYNANGTLTANRTVTMGGNNLTFTSPERDIIFDSNGRMANIAKPGFEADIFLSSGSGATYNRFDLQSFSNGQTNLTASGAGAQQLLLGTHATQVAAPLLFSTSAGGGALGTEKMRITGTGNVGIAANVPTEKLDVGQGNVRIRDINSNAGTASDKIVVADVTGILKTVSSVTAAPQFFYAPSIVLPTNPANLSNGVTYNAGTETFTVNLHGIYSNQFGMAGNVAGATRTAIKSPTASTLSVIPAASLEYFVTYFDNTVFDPTTITLSDAGIMTYKVLPSSTVTEKTYMNIVFKVK
ncbi:hypothetical protein SAMN05421741_1023 [Paenimyroides ummariense]|uniref:Head domain of trimeric autotransporter adhesin n=1 Tax=Paenimyroides ummariense TaxID=913024 RepID=A0A1I4WX53_9FLAO|nr:hypothetical protein [Paenimyroides ummariense]SFN18428.1 hypothetical protein SAMN05421741_1023 [Paenimyroides ummariense]